jgi:hypothetical protein
LLHGSVRSTVRAADFHLQDDHDTLGERHVATRVYNFYSERLFYAGRNGAQDGCVQNIFDQQIGIEQGGVVIREQETGTSIKLDFGYRF